MDEIKSQLQGETVQSVTEWADTTFGPATLERQVMRALEEIGELQQALRAGDVQKIAIEAADACICLYRVIGTINPKAIDEKMAINRARKWNVGPDGCAYHVKA